MKWIIFLTFGIEQGSRFARARNGGNYSPFYNPDKNRSYDPWEHCKSVICRCQLVEIELHSRESIVIVLDFPPRQCRTAEVSLPIWFPDVPLKVPKRLVDFFLETLTFLVAFWFRCMPYFAANNFNFFSISTFNPMSFRNFKWIEKERNREI